MIDIIYEDGVEEEKLPIDNLTFKELNNRIKKLMKAAIKDETTYTISIKVY
jgi:hypothetical protein